MNFVNILEEYSAKIKNKLNLMDHIYSFASILCVYVWINTK